MNRFGRLAASCVLLVAFFSPARAQQLSLTDLQSKLVGAWLATVEGEPRTRNFIVDVVAQKSEGAFVMTGTFSFSDAVKPSPFKGGEIVQSSGNLAVTFTTGADSVYSGSLKPDGTIVGTTKYKNGQEKPFKLEKGVAAPAAASNTPAGRPGGAQGVEVVGKNDMQQLVTGKALRFTMIRDGRDIVWNLDAGGALYARNFTSGSTDSGEWVLNERGSICIKWRGGSTNGCSALIRVDGKMFLASPSTRAPFAEVQSIK